MPLTVYLTFDGTCAEALEFYAEVFGGHVADVQTVGESPLAADLPPEVQGKVLHGTLRIDEAVLYASDSVMGDHQPMAGAHVSLDFEDRDRAKRVFDRLARYGEVTMPFQETFWSPGFGTCRDRFGTLWMIGVAG